MTVIYLQLTGVALFLTFPGTLYLGQVRVDAVAAHVGDELGVEVAGLLLGHVHQRDGPGVEQRHLDQSE